MAELLSTWVVHDLSHLSQITRALCFRYKEAVGPWTHPNYFGIFQDGR